MERAKKSSKWNFFKILLIIVLILIAVVLSYVAYVFLTYHRIADNQTLEVSDVAAASPKTGEEYTAVTYNIGFGAYTPDFTFFMDEGKQSRAASKESVISCVEGCGQTALEFEPDLVMFQEVDTGSTRSYQVEQSEILRQMFRDDSSVFAVNYHSAYLMYPLLEPHGASNSGILTESAFSVSSALRRSLPIATSMKKFLDLDRCYSISRIPMENGKELVVFNTHLSAYGTSAAQGNAQLEMLFADMQKEYEAGNYVICGGDFNHDFTLTSRKDFNPDSDKTYTWCEPFPDEALPEGFFKCVDYTEGLIPTTRYTNIPYSEDSFTVILDGFVVSDNVECTYVQNIDTGFQYSDHNPVVMRFVLK